jgi:hypothetical protein
MMRNPLSIEAFAEFCEKKPADERYNLYRRMDCALGQFAQSLGFIGSTGNFEIEIGPHKSRPLVGLDSWCAHGVLAKTPWTFGALAERLKAQP